DRQRRRTGDARSDGQARRSSSFGAKLDRRPRMTRGLGPRLLVQALCARALGDPLRDARLDPSSLGLGLARGLDAALRFDRLGATLRLGRGARGALAEL